MFTGPNHIKQMIAMVINGTNVCRKVILFIFFVFRVETKVNQKTTLFAFLECLGTKALFLGIKNLAQNRLVQKPRLQVQKSMQTKVLFRKFWKLEAPFR